MHPELVMADPLGREMKVLMVCEPDVISTPARLCEPERIVEFWRSKVAKASWYDPEKEAMVVFCLDRKNVLKGWNLVSLGTNGSTLVHPREVFRPLVVSAASAFAVAHNHPSGDPSPSEADIRVTKALYDASAVMEIHMCDHIVIGDPHRDPNKIGYYSFCAAGLLYANGPSSPLLRDARTAQSAHGTKARRGKAVK